MTDMAADLDRITAERIRDEFTKLLCGADPIAGLRLLVDTGLADRFIPEISGLKLEIDEHAQHKDVYEHTLIVVQNAIRLEGDAGPDFTLRMAALMHDVGKPATKAVGRDGRVSFHHHEVVGARLTKQRMKAMKYPKDVTSDVVELVALHLRFYGYGRGEWTDSAVRRYVTDAGDAAAPPAQTDPLRRDHPQPAQGRAAWPPTTTRSRSGSPGSQAEEDLARVRPDLDGNAIMELLGVPPGPIVGQAWRYLKELRLDRGPLSRDEAEAELLQVGPRATATSDLPVHSCRTPGGRIEACSSSWTPRSARSASSLDGDDRGRRALRRAGRAGPAAHPAADELAAYFAGDADRVHRAGARCAAAPSSSGRCGPRSPRFRTARC